MDQTIAGHVIDAATHAPLAGARVAVTRIVETSFATMGDDAQRMVTAETGQFSFGPLVPGRYCIDVEKPGFAPSRDPFNPDLLDLSQGESIRELVIDLKRGAVVAGGVRDGHGTLAPDATVWAMRLAPIGHPPGLDMVQGGVGHTNDIGEFRIASLPEGDYVLVAAERRDLPYGVSVPSPVSSAHAPTFYPGAADRRHATVLSVRAGQTVGGVWFSMIAAPAFSVSGVVVDQAGAPAGLAMVTLVPSTMLLVAVNPAMSIARSDGTFHISGVLAGSYVISATRSFEMGPTPVAPHQSRLSVAADVTGLRIVAHG